MAAPKAKKAAMVAGSVCVAGVGSANFEVGHAPEAKLAINDKKSRMQKCETKLNKLETRRTEKGLSEEERDILNREYEQYTNVYIALLAGLDGKEVFQAQKQDKAVSDKEDMPCSSDVAFEELSAHDIHSKHRSCLIRSK